MYPDCSRTAIRDCLRARLRNPTLRLRERDQVLDQSHRLPDQYTLLGLTGIEMTLVAKITA
jgi:hypothetical protein